MSHFKASYVKLESIKKQVFLTIFVEVDKVFKDLNFNLYNLYKDEL